MKPPTRILAMTKFRHRFATLLVILRHSVRSKGNPLASLLALGNHYRNRLLKRLPKLSHLHPFHCLPKSP